MLQHTSQICRQTDITCSIPAWNTRLPLHARKPPPFSNALYKLHNKLSIPKGTKPFGRHHDCAHSRTSWTSFNFSHLSDSLQSSRNCTMGMRSLIECVPYWGSGNETSGSLTECVPYWGSGNETSGSLASSDKSVYTSNSWAHPPTQFVYNCRKSDE